MEKNDLSFSNNSDRARATAQINLSHNRDIANNIARIKKRKEEQKRKYVNISSLCDLSTREIDEISPPKTNVLTNYKNSTCMYEVDGIKATIDRSFTNNDFEDNNDTSANMQLCKDCDSVDYFQSEQSIIHSEEDGVIEKEDECYSDLNNEDDSSVESVYGLEQNDREVDDENLSDLEEFENPNIVLKQEPIQFNSDARKRFDAYAFDINSLSEAITKNNDLLYPLAVDDGKKVAKDKLDDITIGEFARMLSEYLITNKITKKGEIDLLKILSSVFGRHYHIPLDVITTKKKVIYSSKISKYNRVNERTVTFDVCSKHQCCVFVGEYAHLRQCYICGSPRYKPCTRGTCKIQKKIGNKDECTHSLLFRKPLLTINYQCILPLICNLSKNDKFRRCLTYEHVKNNAYKYNDVSDGSAFIRNKNEMHDRFKREIEKRREDNRNDMHYEEVSICIAVNYDGVQVCKHKTSTFNPLLMTILSLPPPFRTKYGVGMFLLSLFTLKEKTPAEYFIFNKCLLPELELLGDGYRYQISSNRTAIIQVRLISVLLDTPMLTKQLNVQGHSAYAACPLCGQVYGASPNGGTKGAKPKRVGHRCYLSKYHYLRAWGQSEECCPAKFYEHHLIPEAIKTNYPFTVPINININVDRLCDTTNFNDLREFLSKGNTKGFVWYHKDTFHAKYDRLKYYLYNIHCDYRPQVAPSRILTSSDQRVRKDESQKVWFLKLKYFKKEENFTWCEFHAKMNVARYTLKDLTGESIAERNNTYIRYLKATLCHPYMSEIQEEETNMVVQDIKTSSKTKNKKNSKIVDIIDEMEKIELKSSKINNTEQRKDRISKYQNFVRKENEKLKKINSDGLPLDYLYRIPWKASAAELKKMQTYVNSVFIPVGLTQDIQVKDVFSRQGQLRGTESIYILENLLDFMLLACSIPDAYKQFFSMLSSDVCKMSAHLIKDDNEVNDLFLCTAETISTHEAMFPIFLSDFVYHQLVDIVPHIKCQGPQQHYSTLAGERMNAVIKRFAKTCGGQNATHTVLTNYMHAETYRTENAYSDELEKKICCNSLHESLNANAILIKNSSNGKVVRRIFNDLKCHMQADKISRCDLVDYEFASLVSVLLFEVEKQTKSIDDATSKSSLYCCYTKWFATSGRPKVSKVNNHDAFSLWIVENKGSDVEDFPSKNVLKELLQLKYSLFTKVYQKCTIFGVLFSSRGLEYRIQEEQSFVTDMESIRNNWTDSCQYSSWCRYWSKSVSNPEFSEEQDGTNFSQINCFMRVKLPSDFILNGLPLASIAPRKHKEYRRFPRFDVDLDNIDGLKNLFAVVTNFVPSRVMIVGFDTNELSYEFKEHVIKQDKTKIYYSTQPYSSVKYFCLLSATRKNEGIKYNGSHCGFYNEFEEE